MLGTPLPQARAVRLRLARETPFCRGANGKTQGTRGCPNCPPPHEAMAELRSAGTEAGNAPFVGVLPPREPPSTLPQQAGPVPAPGCQCRRVSPREGWAGSGAVLSQCWYVSDPVTAAAMCRG